MSVREREPRLILVSNRGPVGFSHDDTGRLGRERSGGGLVTALLGLVGHTPALWISAAVSDADEEVARRAGGRSFELPGLGTDTRGRFVVIDGETYHRYYNVIANPMLWFIQHYLWDLSNAPDVRHEELDAWEHGYLAANKAFADAVIDELDEDPDRIVMLHDYHLYTAPEAIRAAHPGAFLHHFVHIPWSQPDYWRILPPHIREGILRGLLANDIVAFHTRAYSRNFLLCCEELLDLRVDYARRTVRWEGREVLVRSYPISVNAPMFEELARSPEVAAEEGAILRRRRQHLIVRVDRTDLSKNTLRGFKAFDVFLDRHPEFHEDITFLAQLQPTRQDVDEYVEYLGRIRDVVSRINTKHGTTDWMPIDLRVEANIHRAVAAYKHYDVLLVNPIFDGMNLIAKEAPLVNERDGVMILSENAGAHEELGHFALTINPFDIEAQAEAIHEALVMAADERSFRNQEIKRIVRENDVGKWLAAQQADIARKRAADRRRGTRARA
ncbi:alpha,alpha-trehalose-phosphate synthase (UDP-forming) [Miltoncostaea marina]|uniref:alpha,alpha-trehalose-phosphate synthase (UDP-forming) n=1 Tax=Miltoncostaea marina TaxID=2843215 RepID=UPI001C3D7C83|nr:trehalose-6-phosphate synthase [Miltoncostaea marina]